MMKSICERLRFVAVIAIVSSGVLLAEENLAVAIKQWHAGLPDSSPGDVVQLVSPGIVVSSTYDLTDEQDFRSLVQIYNALPNVTDQYRSSGSSAEDAYGLILTFKVIPPFSYSREDKASLREVENILLARRCFVTTLVNSIIGKKNVRKPSRRYARYIRYSKAYAEALQQYEQAIRDKSSPQVLAQMQANVQNVEREWIRCGDRKQIENAIATHETLTERDPINVWEVVEKEYRDNRKVFSSGRSMADTSSIPTYGTWFEDKGWTILPHYVPVLEVRRVVIQRPWLDMRVLFSLDWTLLPSAPIDLLSDGKGVAKRVSWPGVMPLLPVEVILGRSSNRGTVQIVAVVSKPIPKVPK